MQPKCIKIEYQNQDGIMVMSFCWEKILLGSRVKRRVQPGVLLLGSQMRMGGAQRVLLDLASWFSDHGVPVTAAFFYDKDGLHREWQAGRLYDIVDLRAWQTGRSLPGNLWQLAGGLIRLFRLLRSQRISGVMAFTHHSNLLGLPVAWLAGVPVRIASHHGRILSLPRPVEKLHALLVNLGIATRLVAVSERTREQAIEEGVKPQHIVVIPNGVALSQTPVDSSASIHAELHLPADSPLILSVGRLVYEKGHTYLLQALPPVLERFPSAAVVFAGDGDLRTALETEASRLGIRSAVHFLGTRGDVPALVASATVFVLPSRSEGLPMALLEAMSQGKAVVCTNVGGLAEAVEDKHSGLMVPGEDPRALATALIELLGNPPLRTRLGNTARQIIHDRFTLDKMGMRYKELLCPHPTQEETAYEL